MRKQDRDLTLDFFTLAIAVLSLSVVLSAWATMFRPVEVFDRVFRGLFGYSMFSVGISYSVFQVIRYVLSCKFPTPGEASGALWIPTIISGTFLFTYFAFDSRFFGHTAVTFGWLLLAIIPAALFRLPVELVIYWWRERKIKSLSIVK